MGNAAPPLVRGEITRNKAPITTTAPVNFGVTVAEKQSGLTRRQIERVTDVPPSQVDPVDEVGELARQPDSHDCARSKPDAPLNTRGVFRTGPCRCRDPAPPYQLSSLHCGITNARVFEVTDAERARSLTAVTEVSRECLWTLTSAPSGGVGASEPNWCRT